MVDAKVEFDISQKLGSMVAYRPETVGREAKAKQKTYRGVSDQEQEEQQVLFAPAGEKKQHLQRPIKGRFSF